MKMIKIILVLTSSWLLIIAHQAVFSTNDPVPPILWLENATASAVAWSPDGTQLAVGDAAGISIYTRDLQFIRFMQQPSDQMKTLQWNPKGTYIAAYGANDLFPVDMTEPRQTTIFIWNADTGTLVTVFDPYTMYVPGLAWSPDGTRIATGGWDSIIHIWDPLTGEIEFTLDAPQDADNRSNIVESLSWSSKGELAATINFGLFVWDNFTLPPRELLDYRRRSRPPSVEWSPDAKFIALGTGIYDVENEQEIDFRFKACPGTREWSPDSKYTAIYSVKGVFICNPFIATTIEVLEGSMGPLTDGLLQNVIIGYDDSLDWSPDGTLLAGAAGDGYVRIWDVSSLTANQT